MHAHGSGYGGSGFKFDTVEEDERRAARKVGGPCLAASLPAGSSQPAAPPWPCRPQHHAPISASLHSMALRASNRCPVSGECGEP